MKSLALVTFSTLILELWAGSIYLDDDIAGQYLKSRDYRNPFNYLVIYPGTKWCGASNVAKNYDDLGVYRNTDMCCRAHDKCDDLILPGMTNHSLTNTGIFTRVNCRCDDEFYNCLKNVNSPVSNSIGDVYFNSLGTMCFREDYPIVGCKEPYGILNQRCAEYEYDMTKNKTYQFFDVPRY